MTQIIRTVLFVFYRSLVWTLSERVESSGTPLECRLRFEETASFEFFDPVKGTLALALCAPLARQQQGAAAPELRRPSP